MELDLGGKILDEIRILKEVRLGASPPPSFSPHFLVSCSCHITILISSSDLYQVFDPLLLA